MRFFTVVLLVLSLSIISACGDDNFISGEDYGNILTTASGLVLTQTEHPEGWGEEDCLFCHNMDNIHQVDRTGTGLNLGAIQSLTKTQGIASCASCHGTNGVE